MHVNPYITFDGQCAEAFRFYESCLGGELFMMTYGDAPDGAQVPPGNDDRIMHASLKVGDTPLMGSDAPPQWAQKPAGFSVSLAVGTVEEAERVFASLSAGGTVTMPLAETFWAHRFAMFVDRFGTPWMINCEKPMA